MVGIWHYKKDSQKKAALSSKKIHVGPWGGNGGIEWDDGSFSGVQAITLKYGRCIDSIHIEYDKNGKSFFADKHGGDGGSHSIHIILHHPAEYLTMISGHISPVVHGGTPVIRALVFKSNQRAFGPFGVQEGTPFTLPMEGGMIVGFSGRSGWYLDPIGLYLTPLRPNICTSVQEKLQKLGNMAYKTLGQKQGDHQGTANENKSPKKAVA